MISLVFHGTDFTEIENGLEETLYFTDNRNLTKKEQLNLLIKFLDSKEDNIEDLIVISDRDRFNDKGKKNIYSSLDGKYFWGGLVGILKGKMNHIFESDLNEEEISEQSNTEYSDIEITIQIQSRFDIDNNGNRAKPYFLSTMLLRCNVGINDQLVPNNDDFFFDLLLLYLFKEKANTCYEKGLYKTYHRFENNNDRLKGSIDIARHIKLNMGLNNGKIAYSYRENTVDNYLNHLIVCAFEKLKHKYPDSVFSVYNDQANTNFKNLIETIKSKIVYPSYDSRTLISKNLTGISHPFFTEYEDLRKISLRILRDEGVSMFDGRFDDVNGVLFYIPDLWEMYLESLLKDQHYTLHIQGFDSKPVRIINYENNPTKYKQTTFPDYVFSYSSEKATDKPFMILDAKFKPAWAEAVFSKGSFSSVLEDYDKCIRDMNSLNAHACGTIFPANDSFEALDVSGIVKHRISEFNNVDVFYTFPIIVPASSPINESSVGYSSWYRKFSKQTEYVVQLVKEYAFIEMKCAERHFNTFEAINTFRE